MAAVVVAMSHGPQKVGARTKKPAPDNLPDDSPSGNVAREDEAAKLIQRAAFPRLIAHGETGI